MNTRIRAHDTSHATTDHSVAADARLTSTRCGAMGVRDRDPADRERLILHLRW